MTNMQKTNYLDTIVQYDIPIGGHNDVRLPQQEPVAFQGAFHCCHIRPQVVPTYGYLEMTLSASFNHHQYFFGKKSTTSTTLALKYMINSLFNSGRNSGRKVVEVVEMWPK